MRLVKVGLIFCLMMCVNSSFSQDSKNHSIKLIDFFSRNIDLQSFKDSSGVYTYNLQILVSEAKNREPVIESSDPDLWEHFRNTDSLAKFNFRPFLGKSKSAKVILPIAIIVVGSSSQNRLVYSSLLSEKIGKLFYVSKGQYSDRNLLYIFPVILTIDKITYD